MHRIIKNFGIGALTALLMVAMLVAPAAAAAVDIYTLGPISGGGPDSGCKDETGDILFSLGTPEKSDWGYFLYPGPDGVPGPLNLSNPPYYNGSDDLVIEPGDPRVHINDGLMGNGSFYTTVGPDQPAGSKLFVRLFNCWESETPTYYGDSIVVTTSGADPEYREIPNFNTTIKIEWPGETFEKDLASGWNLVSLPLTPEDNSVSAVLASIDTNYNAVKLYNDATNLFEDATTMDPGVGYFIHITNEAGATWTYEGDAYEAINEPLSTGLNCIGWVNEAGSALPGVLDSIAGNYRYVARWNAGTQSYEVYLPGAPAVFNDFATMDRGEGYFIVATAGCTLMYPSPP